MPCPRNEEVGASPDEYVRLAVTNQYEELRTVVQCPSGQMFEVQDLKALLAEPVAAMSSFQRTLNRLDGEFRFA